LRNQSTIILFGFVVLLFSIHVLLCDWALRIYIYIYIYTSAETLSCPKISFHKPESRPNVFTDPVVTDLLFRWVGRRKGEIQRHWRQLGPCVCRLVWHLNTKNTHTHTHKHTTHTQTSSFPDTHDSTKFYPFPSSLSPTTLLQLYRLPHTTFPLYTKHRTKQ